MAVIDVGDTKADHNAGGLVPYPLNFATIWLAHWRAHGGTATIGHDDRVAFCYPEWHCSPSHRPAEFNLPDEVRVRHDAFCDGQHTGRMQAMLDMLESVADGRNAIKACLLHGKA